MQAINLAPSVVFSIGSFGFTTTFLLQVFISFLIFFIFLWTAIKWQKRPNKRQLLVEFILQAALNQLDKITNNRQISTKIFPLIFTFFIFILFSNLFTLLPGLGAIEIATASGKTSLFRSVLADYSAVLVLTLVSLTVAQVSFILVNGLGKYLGKFFNFSNPLNFFLGLMDLVGEIAKILSLSFRLFGNVFAGEVLLAVITSLVPLLAPLPFFALSLLSAVIQAYVFALLSAIFISTAMERIETT